MPVTYQYSDVVSDAGTGRPVPNATVTLTVYPTGAPATMYDSVGQVVSSVKTGTTGRFALYAEPGDYNLVVNGTVQLSNISIGRDVQVVIRGPWVDAASYPSLADADTAAFSGGKLLVVSSQIDSVPPTVQSPVVVIPGGKFNNASPVTFASSFSCGLFQCFIGTGTVNFSVNSTVSPEWWGKDIGKAVTALPTSGGTVLLQNDTYNSPYTTEATRLTKSNVAFVGARMPEYNSGYTALANGTIIKGTFWLYAHNLSVKDLGIDVGSASYSTGRDGLLIANDSSHPAATTPWRGFKAENIRVLGRAASDPYHAFLCEYVEKPFVRNIHTRYNTHGIVFKSLYATASGLYASDHSSDGVIIKADTYAQCYHSNFSEIEISNSSPGSGGGLVINAGTATINHINVSGVSINNASIGLWVTAPNGLSAEDIHVSGASITSSLNQGVLIDANTNYVTITEASSNSNGSDGFRVSGNFTGLSNCFSRSNVGNGFNLVGVSTSLSNCIARTNVGYGLSITGPHWVVDCYFPKDPQGPGGVQFGTNGKMLGFTAITVTNPTLTNGWVNYGLGNPAAGYSVANGRVRLFGMVKDGPLAQPIFTLPVGLRPSGVYRQPVLTNNGNAAVLGQLAIDSTGIVVLEVGANGYVSLSGVEFSLACD